jgi:hypothetical protein
MTFQEWWKEQMYKQSFLHADAVIYATPRSAAEAGWQACESGLAERKMSEYLTDPLALAVLFHVTYEKLAPQKGYETRTETRVFDPESANGRLMIATCAAIQKAIRGEAV